MLIVTTITDPKHPQFGQTISTEIADPPKVPRTLSKTQFQDYAVSKLGGGLTGMRRFTEIMDATRDSANPAVRFAYERYQAAVTFEKANTALLTGVMAQDTATPGHLTAAEQAAIIQDWP